MFRGVKKNVGHGFVFVCFVCLFLFFGFFFNC